MNIVFIGDVVGSVGCNALAAVLPIIKHDYKAGLTIVNGENSADGNGIDASSADYIFNSGADVITTGNHSFRRRSAKDKYDSCDTLLRPANYGDDAPGKGVCVLDFGSCSVAVINLIGTAFMQPVDNPFKCVDEILSRIGTKNVIVDFHAEATGEKRAMGCYLSGRVSAVLGTHTHVQTADEEIIDGTGYITDVGMAGPHDSILGIRKDIIINRFLTYYPERHVYAEGKCDICGAFVEIDTKSGKCVRIERIHKIFDGR